MCNITRPRVVASLFDMTRKWQASWIEHRACALSLSHALSLDGSLALTHVPLSHATWWYQLSPCESKYNTIHCSELPTHVLYSNQTEALLKKMCSLETNHCEGTGTRPDYLSHRADLKNEAPFIKLIEKQSGCERWWCVSTKTIDSRRQLAPAVKPNTNAQRILLLLHLLRSTWTTIVGVCRAVYSRYFRYLHHGSTPIQKTKNKNLHGNSVFWTPNFRIREFDAEWMDWGEVLER